MNPRARAAFPALIAAQAAHSVEEYVFRLFDVFAPARAVADSFGIDRPLGFAVANLALIGFGIWCYVARVGPGRPSARAFAWFWAVLELANGFGHIGLAIAAGGYFPGLATAPLLVGIASWLVSGLLAKDRP